MKIGVYGQFYHQDSEIYIQCILDVLQNKNIDIVVEEAFLISIKKHKDISKNYSKVSSFKEIDDSYDFFLSIGGDGTILKSVTYVKEAGIPIIGINTGRLGFLATIQKEKITESLHQILEGNYIISERSLLSITLLQKIKKIYR